MSRTLFRGEYVCASGKRLAVEIERPAAAASAAAVLQLSWVRKPDAHAPMPGEDHLVIRVWNLDSLDDTPVGALPANAALAFAWIARKIGPNSINTIALTASDPKAELFALRHAAELSTLLLGRQLATAR